MDDSLDSWFAREILVHEESLVRYLARSWPKPDEVHDLRQDIYVRVYESALRGRPAAPKAFLFTTARNLMTDRVRRGRIVSIEATGDIDALNVLVDEASPERRTGARQELQRLAHAFDSLPPKCREVVWLRRVEELSTRDTADRMGVNHGTIEKHLARGMELLANFLFGGVHGRSATTKPPEDESKQREYEHGQQ
ncbi:MAG TPA: sigma-70 family RNA polymerase sigma factor [Steroidobacter sp.]